MKTASAALQSTARANNTMIVVPLSSLPAVAGPLQVCALADGTNRMSSVALPIRSRPDGRSLAEASIRTQRCCGPVRDLP